MAIHVKNIDRHINYNIISLIFVRSVKDFDVKISCRPDLFCFQFTRIDLYPYNFLLEGIPNLHCCTTVGCGSSVGVSNKPKAQDGYCFSCARATQM